MKLLVEYQCPQCGAPATLDETDRLFACEYCRVKSYLLQKDFFRYVLPHSVPESETLFFFPYWRFKGILFSSVQNGIKHRFVDVSYRALDSRHFPHSLGLRSQALKLKFAGPESPGRFLEPTLPFETVMHAFMGRFREELPKPVFLQTHIGETLSLIYAPFYVKETLYDGVLNKPVSKVLSEDIDFSLFPEEKPDRIHFVPTLCPQCGWDLDGERNALVLTCNNCNSAWHPASKRLKRTHFAHVPGAMEDALFLPFWRIKADVSGLTLDSYADVVKVANLPKAIDKKWHDIDFFFWSPGFKVRPQTFINLSRAITLSPSREIRTDEIPEGRLSPVTLALDEAVESLKITLASFVKPSRKFLPKLEKITVSPKSSLLVYIPFIEKHSELVSPDFPMAINRNQLAMAKNL